MPLVSDCRKVIHLPQDLKKILRHFFLQLCGIHDFFSLTKSLEGYILIRISKICQQVFKK